MCVESACAVGPSYNLFDSYAVNTLNNNRQTIGMVHMAMENSITHLFLDNNEIPKIESSLSPIRSSKCGISKINYNLIT